jgi:hypothetical protein
LQIVQADRWIVDNSDAVKQNDFTKVDGMPWDSSVQALTRFPDVVQMLSDHLDWTESLGTSFSSQPEDVANVIQMLRAKAESVGNLKSTPEQEVTSREEGGSRVIYIAPANPERIYMPVYDSSVVFTNALTGALIFGTGVLVGSTWNNRWGWNNRRWNQVWINPPVWQPPPPNWRPPLRPGARPPGVRIVLAVARGRIVQAFDQTVLERADHQAFGQTVRGQAGQRDRARADLIDPAQADLTDLVAGQNALERAGPSDQEIGPSGLTLSGPNVPPCVPNAQQNVLPCVLNARPPAVRPISGVGMQARNNDGMQDHNNGLARSRPTDRPSGNKAARDLSNAHAHSNRHGRASITHVHGKVAVQDRISARSGHDPSRVQRRNESCLVGE